MPSQRTLTKKVPLVGLKEKLKGLVTSFKVTLCSKYLKVESAPKETSYLISTPSCPCPLPAARIDTVTDTVSPCAIEICWPRALPLLKTDGYIYSTLVSGRVGVGVGVGISVGVGVGVGVAGRNTERRLSPKPGTTAAAATTPHPKTAAASTRNRDARAQAQRRRRRGGRLYSRDWRSRGVPGIRPPMERT